MRHNRMTGFAIVAMALALAGCGNAFRESMSLNRTTPDEFQVIAHAPLSMPPDIALRPSASSEETPAPTEAQSITINPGATQAPTIDLNARSPGEAAFLQQVGATGVDPNIREIVEKETAAQVERDREVISQLNFWQTPEPSTEGGTPTIERKKGLLQGIF